MSMESSHEVQLAIYDLSRGMARGLSAQFLGPQYAIDAIPHTGVIVYGMEYFFGGGIQCENPTTLRQMTGIMPMQIVTVGRTHVTRAQFDAWCRQKMDSGEFSMQRYDLLNHNCNDFCQVALTQGLKLNQGVPGWILDVPRRFVSSPMGQMVRPMLENMQLGRVDGAQTMTSSSSSSAAPFAGVAPSISRAAAAAAAPNPWAQPQAASAFSSATQIKSTATTLAKETATTTFEILDAHKLPLLANETKTVAMCVEKLVSFAVTEDETNGLRALGEEVSKSGTTTTLSLPHVDTASKLLLRCLETGHRTAFALMLVRLLAIKHAKHCQPCIQWILQEIPKGSSGALQSPATAAMTWLTLSNVVANAAFLLKDGEHDWEALIETSIRNVSPESQPRTEVRQAAAAFLYNTVLTPHMHLETNDELTDSHVSMLCAALDSLDLETDETVRLRRLLVAARILSPPVPSAAPSSTTGRSNTTSNDDKSLPHRRPKQNATAQLIADLGFREALENLAPKHPMSTKSGKLMREILALLSSS